MAESSKFETLLLDPKGRDQKERTFLCGFQLRARSNLFRMLGFASLIILGVVFVRTDQYIETVVDDWKVAREFLILVSRIQSGLARAEMLERSYFLDNRKELVDAFSNELLGIDSALSKMYMVPQAGPIRQQIATLRDGLDQYNREFTKFATEDYSVSKTEGIGTSAKLQKLTKKLSEVFEAADLTMLGEKLLRIMDQGSAIMRSRLGDGLPVIQESYQTLFGLLADSKALQLQKAELRSLLKSHQAHLIKIINRQFIRETKRRQLSEILVYISSSIGTLSKFADNLDVEGARRLEQTRHFARYAIAGVTAAVFLWFMFAGILLFRSIVNPIQSIAFAVGRIASGDREVKIPARGNKDASGEIARALGKWVEDLADADIVRNELEYVREKLEITIAEADERIEAVIESAKAAHHLEIERLEQASEINLNAALPSSRWENEASVDETGPRALSTTDNSGNGRIRYISEQLAHFSDYVTAAAQDVERTEALIRNLNEANSHLEVFGRLISIIEDQVNFHIPQSPSQGSQLNEQQTVFQTTKVDGSQTKNAAFQQQAGINRFNKIRLSTDEAERTLHSIRAVMKVVNAIANDIAKTASDQALEATNKLLTQSQDLQRMLDDIMVKINIDSTKKLFSPPSSDEDELDKHHEGYPEKD